MDRNGRTLLKLVGVAAVMGSLAWASVPMYRLFCQVTGFGGTTLVSEAAPGEILDRTIRINFDGSLERGMPWTFRPVQQSVELRIGETGIAFFEATNPTDRVIAGTASYNVTPYAAGGFFTKIECFCFTEQVLRPHETVQMPVTFYVDPSIVDDPDARHLKHITLSYTFHETPLTEEQAALSNPAATDTN